MQNPGLCASRLAGVALCALLAARAFAYDYPLTADVIRDAYFTAKSHPALSAETLKPYSQPIPELHQGTCTSEARIETPFLQVVQAAAGNANYTSQQAVRDFLGRPLTFRLYLDLCYMLKAPPPNSVHLKFLLNKKEILPVMDVRTAYAEPAGETGHLPANGEQAVLQFLPAALNSSTLAILIDTPDAQHAEVAFDLHSLR